MILEELHNLAKIKPINLNAVSCKHLVAGFPRKQEQTLSFIPES